MFKDTVLGRIRYRKLWADIIKYKKWYYISLIISLFVASCYQHAIPNEYTCIIKIAPELGSGKKSARLASMANRFFSRSKNQTSDVVYPFIYPEIVASMDFRINMLDVIIRRSNDDTPITYYDYLLNYQKKPWWSNILSSPEYIPKDSLNRFKLTGSQFGVAAIVATLVECQTDENTQVITITVKDQDPLVCALIADSAKVHLQNYITAYYSNKAREDEIYHKKYKLKQKSVMSMLKINMFVLLMQTGKFV